MEVKIISFPKGRCNNDRCNRITNCGISFPNRSVRYCAQCLENMHYALHSSGDKDRSQIDLHDALHEAGMRSKYREYPTPLMNESQWKEWKESGLTLYRNATPLSDDMFMTPVQWLEFDARRNAL